MGRRPRWPAVVVVAALAVACGDDGASSTVAASTGEASSTGFSAITGSTGAPGDGPPVATTTGADSTGGDGEMGECNIWTQDCPEGDKCVPWSEANDLVPDDIRCCPVPPNPKLAGEECTVVGYFGSCEDDCEVGTFCMDIDNDGSGVCQPFCQGEPDNPDCGADNACLFYFAGVPICFPQCDPLIQDCQGGYGCYPDEEANGGTGFICLPTVGGVDYGDFCWLLSSCQPGLVCVTPEFIPDCNPDFGCCTQLCDVTDDPDPCPMLHPDLRCVSWYSMGQEPPLAMWANVGVCVIPP